MPGAFYTLEARFKSLLQSGLSPIKAAELLETQWCAYHFHTVDFNLPSGCDWGVDPSDNLTVTLPGGRRITPARITTRPPGLLDQVLIPFSRIPSFKSNAELLKAAMLDAQPTPAPTKFVTITKTQIKAQKIEDVIPKWAILKNRLNDRKARENCKLECQGLGLGSHLFRTRIWPAIRKAAGLPRYQRIRPTKKPT